MSSTNWFDDDHEHTKAFNEYQTAPKHKGHLSHQLIAGAATYEAVKAYHSHVAKNGKPPSHAKAKEIIAGLAGAYIEKQIETHGLDFLDKQKAKRHAEEHAHQALAHNGGY